MVYSFDPQQPKTGELGHDLEWHCSNQLTVAVPSFSQGILWSTIELGVALICACLPTYRPLLTHSLGMLNVVKSWFSPLLDISRTGSYKSSKGLSSSNNSAYARFDRHGLDSIDKAHLTEARAVKHVDGDNQSNSYPLNAISVQSRIEVNWYGRVRKWKSLMLNSSTVESIYCSKTVRQPL